MQALNQAIKNDPMVCIHVLDKQIKIPYTCNTNKFTNRSPCNAITPTQACNNNNNIKQQKLKYKHGFNEALMLMLPVSLPYALCIV